MTLRIDTHHHVVPPEYASWLRSKGRLAGGLPIPEWSPAAALELMDRHQVGTAVLSVSTPGTHLGDTGEAVAMARHVNDYAASIVRDHPGRFGFFATLPLPDVDESIDELGRAMDELHADGVILLANSRGVYPGDPVLSPLFDELQRRRAVVFVHPSPLPGLAPVGDIPPFIADFLLHTTRAAVSLCRTGTTLRCPDVKIILAHAGGFVPYAAYRLSGAASPTGNPVEGLDLLQRFYFDTALSGSPSALPSLLSFARADHVLFGTDWPYAPDATVAAFTGMYEVHDIDESQRLSIDRVAAERLFPRLAGVV